MAAKTPELPRFSADPFTGVSLTGTSAIVSAGQTIAAGITTAQANGHKIVELEAGATFSETLGLGAHPFDFMMIKTQGFSLARTTRITPTLAAANNLAKLAVPDAAYGIYTVPGASRWIIDGLEVLPQNAVQSLYALVATGMYNANDYTSLKLKDIPYKISLRHMYVHGLGALGTSQRRVGMFLGATDQEVEGCWIDRINYGGMDYAGQAQSITGICGIGKLRIENCLIWGSSESIAIGGAAQAVPANQEQCVFSDVIIRGCHFYRAPSSSGIQACENGIEMKIGRRVLIENCILENGWANSTQHSYAFVFWSAEAESGGEFTQTCDITIRNIWVKNYAGLATLPDHYGGTSLKALARVKIDNILMTGLGAFSSQGAQYLGRIVEIYHNVKDYSFSRITAINPGGYLIMADGGGSFDRLDIRNCIIGQTVFSGNTFYNPGSALANAWSDATSSGTCRADYNVFLEPSGTDVTVPTGTGNSRPTSLAAIGFVDSSKITSSSTTFADLASCALAGGSAYKGAGEGGIDPGCNISELTTALTGVYATTDLIA